MTERQKQHEGRSEGDETLIVGRDIKAGAVAATGAEQENGAIDAGEEGSQPALRIEELLEKNRKNSKEGDR